MRGTRISLAAGILLCLTSLEAASGGQPATAVANDAETALAPAKPVAFVPSARKLEVTGPVSGAEPDPESFDRAGLEMWWRHYSQLIAVRADNARR